MIKENGVTFKELEKNIYSWVSGIGRQRVYPNGYWNGCRVRNSLLEGYWAERFIEYTDGAEPLKEMDTDFMLKTLDHIKVFEDGTLVVVFLDGTEIECKSEKE